MIAFYDTTGTGRYVYAMKEEGSSFIIIHRIIVFVCCEGKEGGMKALFVRVAFPLLLHRHHCRFHRIPGGWSLVGDGNQGAAPLTIGELPKVTSGSVSLGCYLGLGRQMARANGKESADMVKASFQ